MQLDGLRELYIDELKDLSSAEQQLLEALPEMAKKATNAQLRHAFESHLAETERHVERLQQIFQSLESGPTRKHSKGMEALIAEVDELMRGGAQADALDAKLISKAQQIEHYEIASYGTARTYAMILGESDHVKRLAQTLDEEQAANALLTELGEELINIDAAIGDESSARSNRARLGGREVQRETASDRAAASAATPRNRSTEKSDRARREG